jgi:hypothetical protein
MLLFGIGGTNETGVPLDLTVRLRIASRPCMVAGVRVRLDPVMGSDSRAEWFLSLGVSPRVTCETDLSLSVPMESTLSRSIREGVVLLFALLSSCGNAWPDSVHILVVGRADGGGYTWSNYDSSR